MRTVPLSARCFGALFLVASAAFFWPNPAHAQSSIGAWEAHTAMREVRGLARSDSALWVATTGGVYRYAPQDGDIRRFTVTNGLHDVNARAIAYDPSGPSVWVGYRDGVIDRFNPASGAVTSFQDIARSDRFSQSNIHRLQVRGDSLYAATAFGVVVFDKQTEKVRDSYTDLGSLNAASDVYDLTFAPTPAGEPGLWLATESGMAYASMQAANLKDPASWTVEPTAASDDQLIARSVAAFNGSLYVGMDVDQESDYNGDALGLYRRAQSGRYERVPHGGGEVKALSANENRLYGTRRWGAFMVEASGQAHRLSDEDIPYRPNSIIADSDGSLWIGDQRGLVAAHVPASGGNTLQVEGLLYPDGPYENSISSLHVDESGRLIVGGSNQRGTGFYVLRADGTWKSYTSSAYEDLPNENYNRVYGQRDGHVWAGSFGDGVAMVTPDGTVKNFDARNSSLAAADGENFVVVGGLSVDPDGRLWVTTQLTRGAALHVRSREGQWTALPNLLGPGRVYSRLFIDSYNQKWIIADRQGNLNVADGLAVLDTKGTPTNPDDDAYRLFDQEWQTDDRTGLPSTFVNAVTEDRDGVIWVATNNGIAQLTNTGVVADDPNVQFSLPQLESVESGEDPYLLHGLAVNDIAIDAANRLWVATEKGVYHAREVEGGYRILDHFTQTNAPLPDNSVQSVAANNQTGVVYFGTDRGLVGYRSEAIQPADEKKSLTVYPNPVRMGEDVAPDIYIEGLVEETEVRILTPDGRTVAQLEGRGGRVRWDGRDRQGQLVPSGVYLVVAVGQNGEGAAYGKVAVLR
jgi:ligand-binding sensor domain-containing protein